MPLLCGPGLFQKGRKAHGPSQLSRLFRTRSHAWKREICFTSPTSRIIRYYSALTMPLTSTSARPADRKEETWTDIRGCVLPHSHQLLVLSKHDAWIVNIVSLSSYKTAKLTFLIFILYALLICPTLIGCCRGCQTSTFTHVHLTHMLFWFEKNVRIYI